MTVNKRQQETVCLCMWEPTASRGLIYGAKRGNRRRPFKQTEPGAELRGRTAAGVGTLLLGVYYKHVLMKSSC